MKRIISILLALMLIVSLIPSAFALEEDGYEIPLSNFKYRNGNSTFTPNFNEESGVLSVIGFQVRRYEESETNGNSHGQFGVLFFKAEESGEFEVYFRTNNPTQTSAAIEVYIREYTTTIKKAVETAAAESTKLTKSKFLGTAEGSDTGIGYFDFCHAPKDTYAPLTSNGKADGTTSTVTLEKGKEYFIILTPESYSLLLNPWVTYSGNPVNIIDKGLIDPVTGNKAVNPTTGNKYSATDLVGHSQQFYLSGIKLVPVPQEDADYTKDFDAVEKEYTTSGTATVNAYAFAGAQEELSIGNTVSLGESFSATAPEKEGFKFLYWAKGLGDKKQVISYDETLSYRPSEGANYVIAVYVKDGEDTARAEFYNANGQLIATLGADGKAPKYPSMAGFGVASGWQLYGSDEIFASESDITVSGNMVFVAKYDKDPETVLVNGKEYSYGETVKMPSLDSSKIFKGWKRNGEIVSTDKSYTFKAWENATVEAVYAESTPTFSGKFTKIILDAFTAGNDTAVMAEFVGLDGAIEKGIKIGNTKIPMRSGDNQFSILADIDGAYTGYAILRDGEGFIEITDGSTNIE